MREPKYKPGMVLAMEWPDGASEMGTLRWAPAQNIAIQTPQGLFGFSFNDNLAPMFLDAKITVIKNPYTRRSIED